MAHAWSAAAFARPPYAGSDTRTTRTPSCVPLTIVVLERGRTRISTRTTTSLSTGSLERRRLRSVIGGHRVAGAKSSAVTVRCAWRRAGTRGDDRISLSAAAAPLTDVGIGPHGREEAAPVNATRRGSLALVLLEGPAALTNVELSSSTPWTTVRRAVVTVWASLAADRWLHMSHLGNAGFSMGRHALIG